MTTRDRGMALLDILCRPMARKRTLTRSSRRLRPTISGSGGNGGELLERRLVLSAGAQVHVMAMKASGNTLRNAIPVGGLTVGQNDNLSGSVSAQAPNRYYKFSVGSQEVIQAALSGLKGKVNLTLLNASGQPIVSTTNGGASSESLRVTLGPGTYYIRVSHSGKGKTGFGLSLAASALPVSPAPNPGSTTTTPPGGTTTTPPGGTPGSPGTPSSAIPAQGNYDITMTGTTYYGNANFLMYATQFTPYTNFSRNGNLVLTPTIDKTNAAGNGVNPRDLLLVTGNFGVGGAGVILYATNTRLYQLVGGNGAQAADLDVAYVTENDTAGTITVKPDLNQARVSQLAVMYVSNGFANGVTSTPYAIIVGEIDVQFLNGGSQVTGTVVLYGEGTIEAGTVAIKATFSGALHG